MKNEKNLDFSPYCSQTVTDKSLILAVHIEHDRQILQYNFRPI